MLLILYLSFHHQIPRAVTLVIADALVRAANKKKASEICGVDLIDRLDGQVQGRQALFVFHIELWLPR